MIKVATFAILCIASLLATGCSTPPPPDTNLHQEIIALSNAVHQLNLRLIKTEQELQSIRLSLDQINSQLDEERLQPVMDSQLIGTPEVTKPIPPPSSGK